MKKSDKKIWVIILGLIIAQLVLITFYAYSDAVRNLSFNPLLEKLCSCMDRGASAILLIDASFLPIAVVTGILFAKLKHISGGKKRVSLVIGFIAGATVFVLSILIFLQAHFIAR